VSRKALSLPINPEILLPVAEAAGDIIMLYYQKDSIVTRKADNSPVTQADHEADAYIVKALLQLAPGIPVVSEEGDKPDISRAEFFWLVDPLDGTRSFVRGSGYFTVNIGLIGPERFPVAGVIYDPVHKAMYWGSDNNAFRRISPEQTTQIHMRKPIDSNLTALVSSHHLDKKTEAYLAARNIKERIPCASSIKFCRLAEGMADIYPRFGPTMEWDTAAGHAILLAAGGELLTPEGMPFIYGNQRFENSFFIARDKKQTLFTNN
jgi:3'(2'), 5'-bisphosphate nucleotidase